MKGRHTSEVPPKGLELRIYSCGKKYQLASFMVLDKIIHTKNPYLKKNFFVAFYVCFTEEKLNLGYQVGRGSMS